MKSKGISELCLTVILQDNQPNDYKVTMPDSVDYEFGSFEKILKHTQESQYGHFCSGKQEYYCRR